VRLRSLLVGVGVLGVAGLALSVPAITHAAGSVSRAPTVHQASVKAAHAARPTRSSNLYYHGGTVEAGVNNGVGIGVETGADKVYLVYWGSQWNGNDPSGEAALQQSFFNGVGGSSWNNSVTQYCQGAVSGAISSGATTCPATGVTHASNPSGVLGNANVWYDNASAAPASPTQSQLAAEAISAAAHFVTTATSNTAAQYVISTATHNNSSGFGTQYCAWHSSTSSSYGDIAYTNMPYITDAGASCGANFNGLGANAGITIVGGHEFAETETDIFPSSGWLDSRGSENGDKCAWISSGQGAAADITLTTGTFAVQSLWSNASSGCVLSYP
jgi:hypothetical protein